MDRVAIAEQIRHLARKSLPAGLKPWARQVGRRLGAYERDWGADSLRLAMHDLVRHGDTCFDVGANTGDYSIFMSKLTGPTGRVHAFDPNPLTLPTLHEALAKHKVSNCQVVEAAVLQCGPQSVEFFLDHSPGHGAATIIPDQAVHVGLNQKVVVKAICLDEYCRAARLRPAFVKVDVETAELDVLKGFAHTIDACMPHFILEYGSIYTEQTSLMFLRDRGYRLTDLSNYSPVDAAEFASRRLFTNVLAIHASKIGGTGYGAIQLDVVLSKTGADLGFRDGQGELLRSGEFGLKPGRYIAACDFTAEAGQFISFSTSVGDSICGVAGKFGEQDWSHSFVFEVNRPSNLRFSLSTPTKGRVLCRGITLKRAEMRVLA